MTVPARPSPAGEPRLAPAGNIELVAATGCGNGWRTPSGRVCSYTGGCTCVRAEGHSGRCRCECGSTRTRPRPLTWSNTQGGQMVGWPDCAECLDYLTRPGMIEAAASVGIERGKSTGQLLREVTEAYHDRRHEELR